MLLSKIIESFQIALNKHGDHHVVDNEEITLNLTEIEYDTKLGVFRSIVEDQEDEKGEVLVRCDNCDECKTKDKILYRIDEEEKVCKDCFGNDYEYELYTENLVNYVADTDGNFTVPVWLVKDGVKIESSQK